MPKTIMIIQISKSIPKLDKYPDGNKLPTPSSIDFTPSIAWMCFWRIKKKIFRVKGHKLVLVTSNKDAKGCKADKELVDARCR